MQSDFQTKKTGLQKQIVGNVQILSRLRRETNVFSCAVYVRTERGLLLLLINISRSFCFKYHFNYDLQCFNYSISSIRQFVILFGEEIRYNFKNPIRFFMYGTLPLWHACCSQAMSLKLYCWNMFGILYQGVLMFNIICLYIFVSW